MDAIKQILKKGEELLTGRRRKRLTKEIIVNAEALENRVAVMEDGMLEEPRAWPQGRVRGHRIREECLPALLGYHSRISG